MMGTSVEMQKKKKKKKGGKIFEQGVEMQNEQGVSFFRGKEQGVSESSGTGF